MQKFWSGRIITSLEDNQVFVFGSNPEGRHGMGAAKSAMQFGAKYGVGRGLRGQTYALVTKNLKAGFKEPCTGIVYEKAGKCSVPLFGPDSISSNIHALYVCARNNPKVDFLVSYQSKSNNLNGFSPDDIMEAFIHGKDIPPNVIFHNSFYHFFTLPAYMYPEFRVIIAGGRDYTDLAYMTKYMDYILRDKLKTHRIIIVSGVAKGADKTGEAYARLRKFKIEHKHAKWKDLDVEGAVIKVGKYGEYNAAAGGMRNREMAKVADVVVAFWDGISSGTQDMIRLAEEFKLPCKIVEY